MKSFNEWLKDKDGRTIGTPRRRRHKTWKDLEELKRRVLQKRADMATDPEERANLLKQVPKRRGRLGDDVHPKIKAARARRASGERSPRVYKSVPWEKKS